MSRSMAWLLAAGVGVTGCTTTHPGAMYARVDDRRVVAAPKVDRCEAFKGAATTFAQCQDFKQQAVNYLHKLSTGDAMCVENGFGEEPREGCKARAFIIDADNHGFTTEIRYPALDSKWKDANQQKIYFENGALVDLYLRERGYE
jgi:hypothetical protein